MTHPLKLFDDAQAAADRLEAEHDKLAHDYARAVTVLHKLYTSGVLDNITHPDTAQQAAIVEARQFLHSLN